MTNQAEIEKELRCLDEAGLLRRLRTLDSAQRPVVTVNGHDLINFSSNDYLGLADSDELKDAMIEGVQRFGAGAGASRLVCGNLAPHAQLEETLASFKNTEAALAFSSGYAVAMGVIPALCRKGDSVILDKLSHACLIDAARLSGATIRVFPHNNVTKLAYLLKTVRANSPGRILVATESIFSMDGDAAPLCEIAKLCEDNDALLLVDEAHAVGVLGPGGRGLIAELGLEKRVPLQMGTLGKALGVSGGYVAASRSIIDLLINKARSLIYSTAPPPAVAFAAARAVEIVQGKHGDGLRARLRENLIEAHAPLAAILPIIIGDASRAMQSSAALLEQGFLVPAIRYPTVARGSARLRVTLSAAHERNQIEALIACLRDMMPQLPATVEHPAGQGAQ